MTKAEFLATLTRAFQANFGTADRSEEAWWLATAELCEHRWDEKFKEARLELSGRMHQSGPGSKD